MSRSRPEWSERAGLTTLYLLPSHGLRQQEKVRHAHGQSRTLPDLIWDYPTKRPIYIANAMGNCYGGVASRLADLRKQVQESEGGATFYATR